MVGELRVESIKKTMHLAVESGAADCSIEHVMASQLFFLKAKNRKIFFTFATNEGSLSWLKRWYFHARNMYS